ncbi:MAG: crosslink repair DNA glycosylase YcaQ family protein [Acidimicrobiia bacterium]|nr:crosslink repair DNA glycosylase YcaQ family protein [Acidimicrobiia bacterium]MDX2467859.1 crosslink repair DNA glycosylase YcaQ family protein [Acidimicrobiia bacterium]
MRHLDRTAVLNYRLYVNHLTGRKLGTDDISTAAHSGLQDGSPLSGLLSLAARVEGTRSSDWQRPELAQVFGPRGAIYIVRQQDIGVFSRGLLPRDPARIAKLEMAAAQVNEQLAGSPMRQAALVATLPKLGGTRGLRWAATTGSIAPVWDTIDTIVHPITPVQIDAETARLELARRFFRYLGPATVGDLQWWLDGLATDARETVRSLGKELETVSLAGRSCLVLRSDDALVETEPDSIHVLPPDDPYINRRIGKLLVPDPARRRLLWPQAPPPGALVIGCEVAGTWRRRDGTIDITPWRDIPTRVRNNVGDVAGSLPLPDTATRLRWSGLV